jgi:hypothetical protein
MMRLNWLMIGRIVERLVFDRYADAAASGVAVDAEQKVLLRRAQECKLANSWHVELSRADHVDSEPSGESGDSSVTLAGTAPSRSHTINVAS